MFSFAVGLGMFCGQVQGQGQQQTRARARGEEISPGLKGTLPKQTLRLKNLKFFNRVSSIF